MNLRQRLGRDAMYVLTGFPIALFSFILLVTLFSVGAGTLVIVCGLPLVALSLLAARGFADLERLRLRNLLGLDAPRPRYQRVAPDAGLFRRLYNPLRQGQSWLDLLHSIVQLPVATVTWSLVLTWWSAGLGGVTYFIWGRYLPYGDDNHDAVTQFVMGNDNPTNRLVLHTALGVFCLITVPFLQRGCAAFQGRISVDLLSRIGALQGRIDDLTESRAAAVSAEATALRKIERDIHDGPQQRLTRLAMDLSRAKRQLDSDPAGARETLDEALGATKETLDELRALSRGIAPPVLADRGLYSALTALAARATVPVELSITVAERLPASIENALYFTTAEALTNIAKHSGASGCRIELARQDERLYLTILDNGTGGAHLSKGHGLTGLADRLRAVDGQLTVSSPEGGPTVLVAEVPL